MESEGLSKFAETFVDLGAKRGRFKYQFKMTQDEMQCRAIGFRKLICHHIHTVSTDAYKETQRQVPEVKKYEDSVANLCKYVKQVTVIQETLPVSWR